MTTPLCPSGRKNSSPPPLDREIDSHAVELAEMLDWAVLPAYSAKKRGFLTEAEYGTPWGYSTDRAEILDRFGR
ncbi:MAG: hypothetical protein AAFY99_04685 [Pseudomonadota bacterium]